METRGREAKAEREVANVVNIADARPEPPSTLSVKQAEVWKRVVSSMHPSWFRKEYQDHLVGYCRQSVLADYFHDLADGFPVETRETDAGLKQFLDITRAAERADRAVDKFGTTLRITPQSRYDKDKAARDSNKTQARPW